MATSFGLCRPSSDHHRAINRPSSGHHQVINRPSSGHHQVIIRLSSGHHQVIIRSSSGHHQVIIRPSTGQNIYKNLNAGLFNVWFVNVMGSHSQTFFPISNGRYIDYLSLTYATNNSRILKVTL